MRVVLLAAAILLCQASGGSAAESLPYDVLSGAQSPAAAWLLDQDNLDRRAFPDARPGVLRSATYAEVQTRPARRYGLVTCAARSAGFVSLLYYAGNGSSFAAHRALPLPVNHTTTLTFRLPVGEYGITRLILWKSAPADSWLRHLALNPNDLSTAVPGLVAQRWFQRDSAAEMPRSMLLPWEGSLRRTVEAPASFLAAPWPWFSAHLAPGHIVEAKNCAVLFDGIETFDVYGVARHWPLSWSAQLEVDFELPLSISVSQAQLEVAGLPVKREGFGPADLEVTVNGWRVPWPDAGAYAGDAAATMQLSAWQVGQYLKTGSNTVVLAAPTGVESWQVEAVRLWIQ
jgi:hypothetical protein